MEGGVRLLEKEMKNEGAGEKISYIIHNIIFMYNKLYKMGQDFLGIRYNVDQKSNIL